MNAPHCLRYHGGHYYNFHVRRHKGYSVFVSRSPDLKRWEDSPFNPVHFDAAQWAEAAKAGGFAGIVLTTKHHDGFCNWQTDTTDYSVRSTPWKDGKGDVVAEVAKACREAGLTFGIYISIWDLHYEHSGRPLPAYADYYVAQLTELSTRYGHIDEYWFDGFGAKHTKVDFAKVAEIIRTNQPKAVVYDSFTLAKHLPDRCLRFPGRHGAVRDPCWSRNKVDGIVRWYPNEASLILQGNWFHNGRPITDLKRIQNYYLGTVGRNALPLMNVSPNQDGLIDEASIARLKEFKAWVDAIHAADLVQRPGVKVTANTTRGYDSDYGAPNVADGNYDTYFATDDGVTRATIEVALDRPQEIGGFILQEYIPLGQRVSAYSIDCMLDGKWVEVFAGQTIGYKRVVIEGLAEAHNRDFPATDRVRLRIKSALACPVINRFGVLGGVDEGKE